MMEKAGDLVQQGHGREPGTGPPRRHRDGYGPVWQRLDYGGDSAALPGATLDIFVMSPGGLARTNMPHVFSNTRKYQENEIVLHSRQVGLDGYRAEIERTFFLGKPSDKQREVFRVMTELSRPCWTASGPV